MDLRKVIGFPGYLMDVDDGTVWSYIGGRHALKPHERANGTKVVHLSCNGKHHTVMYYRLWYACRHNIPIGRIPTTLYVKHIQPGNVLQLCTRQDIYQDMMAKKNAQLAIGREDLFKRKLHELLLMQRTYDTGDWRELMEYADSLRDDTIRWYSHKYNVKEDAACLLFDAAVERLIVSLKKPHSMVTDITGNLRGLMRKESARTKAIHMQEYLGALHFPEQPLIKPTLQSVQL